MGQERFHSLVPIYYRNAQAVIVMYDIQCLESFMCAKNWIKDLKDLKREVSSTWILNSMTLKYNANVGVYNSSPLRILWSL